MTKSFTKRLHDTVNAGNRNEVQRILSRIARNLTLFRKVFFGNMADEITPVPKEQYSGI